MKVGLLIIGIILGLFIGFQYSPSNRRLKELEEHLNQWAELDIEEYLRLKKMESEYLKADEMLGKVLLIFLADLKLRLSDKVTAFAQRAASSGPKATPQSEKEIGKSSLHTLPKAPEAVGEPLPVKREKNVEKTPVVTGGFTALTITSGIFGRITTESVAPPAQPIRLTPECKKLVGATVPIREDLLIDGSKGIANVFVSITEGVNSMPTPTLPPVVFDQKGCQYLPHVLGLRVGQELQSLNSDPTMHNVHALPTQNPGFNMGMATAGQAVRKRFPKPERMIRIKCDVHNWMSAYIGVVDHPYFATTGLNGNYRFSEMPPAGEYTVEAWHEKLGVKTKKISIKPGEVVTELNFNF